MSRNETEYNTRLTTPQVLDQPSSSRKNKTELVERWLELALVVLKMINAARTTKN